MLVLQACPRLRRTSGRLKQQRLLGNKSVLCSKTSLSKHSPQAEWDKVDDRWVVVDTESEYRACYEPIGTCYNSDTDRDENKASAKDMSRRTNPEHSYFLSFDQKMFGSTKS